MALRAVHVAAHPIAAVVPTVAARVAAAHMAVARMAAVAAHEEAVVAAAVHVAAVAVVAVDRLIEILLHLSIMTQNS